VSHVVLGIAVDGRAPTVTDLHVPDVDAGERVLDPVASFLEAGRVRVDAVDDNYGAAGDGAVTEEVRGVNEAIRFVEVSRRKVRHNRLMSDNGRGGDLIGGAVGIQTLGGVDGMDSVNNKGEHQNREDYGGDADVAKHRGQTEVSDNVSGVE
jgi:hypothetical protein